MTCKHEYRTLTGQTLYQWCHLCGSVFNTEMNKEARPRLLDVVVLKEIELTDQEKDHCRVGNKIHAIKEMRNRTGLGLYMVKQIIDEYVEKNPPTDAPWMRDTYPPSPYDMR